VLRPPAPDPFPHLVVDGLWSEWIVEAVAGEFPQAWHPGWRRYDGEHERKLEGSDPTMWGTATQGMIARLLDPEWCDELGEAFGITGLVGDTIGGGYHSISCGGRLDVHTDFSVHPTSGLYRRLNCLVYLNRSWRPEHGGALELHDADGLAVTVEPFGGRTAIFATSATSWHGHPVPWAGPSPRKSVAAYYFAPEPPPGFAGPHSTVWRS